MCRALCTRDYDFGLLHVKAVDDAGHDRDVYLKVKLLEQVDQMMGQIIKHLWIGRSCSRPPPVLVVTGDHSTPASYGDHSSEPVPIVMAFFSKTVMILI